MEQSGRSMNTQETNDEAGLEDVYPDMLRFGCLRVFRHFDLYLRGKEELLVTVRTRGCNSSSKSNALRGRSVWRNHQRQTNQRPLPPASPASSELKQANAGETLFLLGVYARYKHRPYVWLRSQRSESSASGLDPDVPLLLQTTSDWETNPNLRIWDVVEELVDLNSHPACGNPFEVDFEALRGLPPVERVCMAAATAWFLEASLLSRSLTGQPRPNAHDSALKSDMRRLLEVHFQDLRGVLPASPTNESSAPSLANIWHPAKSHRI